MDFEKISDYVNSLEPDLPEYLREIEKFGRDNYIPIIRKPSISVLRFAINSYKPKNILEIGTAIGFSACLMSEFASKDTCITTIEKSETMISIAEDNFKKCEACDRITLLGGDAASVLEDLVKENKKFDFVFLDAAKAQYMEYLKSIDKLLIPGGILLTDNTLQEGSVYSSKFMVERRDRTTHVRMREFIDYLYHNEDYISFLNPLGDGILFSQKRDNNEK